VSVFGDGHVEVLVPQVQGDKLGDVRFVLDDQYARSPPFDPEFRTQISRNYPETASE
jgi:hypothetical protein